MKKTCLQSAQGWNGILVSLKTWKGQLLSLKSLPEVRNPGQDGILEDLVSGRVTVERESKDLNALQEDLARHMGNKPKTSWVVRPMQQISIFGDVVYPRLEFQVAFEWLVYQIYIFKFRNRLKALVTWKLQFIFHFRSSRAFLVFTKILTFGYFSDIYFWD